MKELLEALHLAEQRAADLHAALDLVDARMECVGMKSDRITNECRQASFIAASIVAEIKRVQLAMPAERE